MSQLMPHQEKAILYVEDEEDDLFFLKRAFASLGLEHRLHRLADGQQAMDFLAGLARRSGPLPCLILLDVKLPIKSGFELLQWLRNEPRLKWLPVVCYSEGAAEDIDRAYTLGANGFVRKPGSIEEFERFASALKRYWMEHNALPHNPLPPQAG